MIKNLSFKNAIFIITILFIFSIITGCVLAFYLSKDALFRQVTIEVSHQKLSVLPTDYYYFFYLISHNLVAALVPVILFFFFGLYSIFHILYTGYHLGLVAVYSYRVHDLEGFFAGILPHGIFEVPGIILSDALGFYIGIKFLRKVFAKEHKEFQQALRTVALILIKFVIPLFLIAGLIEAYITPRVALSVEQKEGHIGNCRDSKLSSDALNYLKSYGYCKE